MTRPPMNILIMSGVNTCGYGTKKAFTSSIARGDAALLHRLGVSMDKTVGKVGDFDEKNNEDASAKKKTEGGVVAKRKQQRKYSFTSSNQNNGDDDDESMNLDYQDEEFEEDDEDDGDENYNNNVSPFGNDEKITQIDGDGDEDEDAVIEEIDASELPGVNQHQSPSTLDLGSPRRKSNVKPLSPQQQKEMLDSWLTTKEALVAAQKAVPEHLLNLSPTELLQYWKTAQENRSIWIGMARVITSLAVRFRIFDIDTKRTEQNTARRHLQPHMASMMTSELKVDSTSSPSKGQGIFK